MNQLNQSIKNYLLYFLPYFFNYLVVQPFSRRDLLIVLLHLLILGHFYYASSSMDLNEKHSRGCLWLVDYPFISYLIFYLKLHSINSTVYSVGYLISIS
jgi:5'(3')-deoxyribonucleotidase